MITLSNGHSFSVAAASGALGYGNGYWFHRLYHIPFGRLDYDDYTIITKTLPLQPRKGNFRFWKWWKTVKFLENGGMVNAYGLRSKGLKWWIDYKYYKYCIKLKRNIIVSIMPETIGQAHAMADMLNPCKHIKGVEINISCPNTEKITDNVAIVREFASRSRHPIGVKYSYHDDYIELIKVLYNYVEWHDLINTIKWSFLHPNNPSPLAPKYEGGVSGPDITHYSESALTYAKHNSNITKPILSGGGIFDIYEANVRFEIGASAITLGSLIATNPKEAKIINSLIKMTGI